jgi:hypothetical protein
VFHLSRRPGMIDTDKGNSEMSRTDRHLTACRAVHPI